MKDKIYALIQGGMTTKKQIVAELGLSTYQWNSNIKKLVTEGLVRRSGTRKAATYSA